MLKIAITYKLIQRYGGCENFRKLTRRMSTLIDDVVIDIEGDKGIITLNRPKALNALNLSMVHKILPCLQEWEKTKSLVLVKGAGEKSFCAGGDVRAIVESNMRGEKLGEEFFRCEYTMNAVIGNYKQPYIALIDGITMGGGVGLSVHGRYRVATERTLFAMPETAIALFPDVGGSYFLPKLQDKLGLYLALTGHRLKGADVYKAGIATHYVPSKNIPGLEQALINSCNDEDIKNILKKFHQDTEEEFSLCPYIDKIKNYFSAPTVEQILERLKQDDSEWAKTTVETLCKMSPTSMKVSKHLLDTSEKEKMTLEQCLSLEYRVACNTLQRKEFNEGVRALLIDKDQKPKWNPATIEEVSKDVVLQHFKPLPEDQELKFFRKNKL